MSSDDDGLLKRRFPPEPKVEEEEVKRFELDQSKLTPEDVGYEPSQDKLDPVWIKMFLRKLPTVGVKAARGDDVNKVIARLIDWNIPDERDILF